jgi:hypothetical protein
MQTTVPGEEAIRALIRLTQWSQMVVRVGVAIRTNVFIRRERKNSFSTTFQEAGKRLANRYTYLAGTVFGSHTLKLERTNRLWQNKTLFKCYIQKTGP